MGRELNVAVAALALGAFMLFEQLRGKRPKWTYKLGMYASIVTCAAFTIPLLGRL